MSKALVALSSLLLLVAAGRPPGLAAASQSPDCRPPAPAASHQPNIFTEEQENDLGDAIAEHIGREFRVIDDDHITTYLKQIGQRIVLHLPPTKLQFQFFLVDLPDANAFVLPGGRIFISRKLIALTRSEDELAAVIGHETGHLVARQQTVIFSRLFKDVLGVTSVGDRADVFEKYNEWMDNIARKPWAVRTGDSDGEQIEADLLGVYALAASGYDPQAHARFFDRFANTRGNTGGFFSNLFGTTSPDSLRLKEILKRTQALPARCVDVRPQRQDDVYQQWRSAVVSFTGLGRKERLHAVTSQMALEPPLRSDVTRLRFSPDGRLVLAQDDGGVTVLTREPFQVLFRIDVSGAAAAQFSPDSKSVLFHTTDLRVERWDLASQALAEAHEVFIRKDCLQVALSPDGRILACLDGGPSFGRYNLTLVDVASGAAVFDVPEFTAPDAPTRLVQNVRGLNSLVETGWHFITMSFSPDGRFFAAAHHRDGFPGISAGEDALAYDLVHRVEISMKGEAKRLMAAGFTFTGPDRIVASSQSDPRKSVVISLPAGDFVEQTALPKGELAAPTRGAFLLVRPFQDSAVGVMDLARRQVVKKLPNDAIDIYAPVFVAERGTGELGLYTMDNTLSAVVTLPRSSLSGLVAASVSEDFRWLAVSERSRGSVWDLASGRSVTQTRPFGGATFTGDDLLVADFSKLGDEARRMMRVDPLQKQPPAGLDIKDDHAMQVGPFLVVRRPLKKGTSLTEGLEIEVRDAARNATLWTKSFAIEPPQIWTNARASGSMILGWPMTSRTARAEARDHEALGRRPAAVKPLETDYLLEILDMRTGEVRGRLVFETGGGSFDVANVVADDDVVAIADSENRVHIYSLGTGESRGRVFGNHALVSAAAGAFVVENGPRKLTVYDAATMRRRDDFAFSHNIAMTAFSPDGRKLFVLTSDQTAYVLDLAAAQPFNTGFHGRPRCSRRF